MISQKALYDLCESFIDNRPKLNPSLSLAQMLQGSNILDINVPRACGKTNVVIELSLAYPNTIIIPANRNMLRGGYNPIPKDRLINHTEILESYIIGTRMCPLECKIIIIDDCPKITPENILLEYLRYPHQNRSLEDLVWQAPKVIALGTRYKL